MNCVRAAKALILRHMHVCVCTHTHTPIHTQHRNSTCMCPIRRAVKAKTCLFFPLWTNPIEMRRCGVGRPTSVLLRNSTDWKINAKWCRRRYAPCNVTFLPNDSAMISTWFREIRRGGNFNQCFFFEQNDFISECEITNVFIVDLTNV